MSKIILGINCYHADSAACIIKNSNLLFAIEEERINRIKHYSGFPEKAIQACLDEAKVSPNEITDISINTNPYSNIFPKIAGFIQSYLVGNKKKEIIKRNLARLSIKKEIIKKFNISQKIRFHKINHHLSHIASAYYPSGFNKALGLSIDGSGDYVSLSIAVCQRKNINIVDQVYFPHSLGIFYEAMTQLAGFKNFGDEYKIMGLSSYGIDKYSEIILKNVVKPDGLKFKLNLKYFNHHKNDYTYSHVKNIGDNLIFNKNINKLLNIKNNHGNLEVQKNIAASAQVVFEIYLNKILIDLSKKHKIPNIVFAGGCALNSLANGKVLINSDFKNIFIPYAPSDSGGAIGSALYVNEKIYNLKTSNLTSPFLGKEYSNDQIKEIIDSNDLSSFKIKFINKNDLLYDYIVSKLINSKIIGWFQSKMEFGSRALGNRSILADPRDKNMKDIINSKIKRRESFRPFAPSILEEEKNNWFETKYDNIYMSAVEKIKKEKRKLIPAVTHVDGTGRVQSVKLEMNEKFYNLIKHFFKHTDVPILLNTSFNENEPIICQPQEAINCFLRTDLDVVVIGNFVIERN